MGASLYFDSLREECDSNVLKMCLSKQITNRDIMECKIDKQEFIIPFS